MEKIIITCTNVKALGAKLTKVLDVAIADYELKQFPDGELYFRIDSNVKGKEVIFVQGGYPNPNDSLMETLLGVLTVKELGAKKVTLVFPYFPYARQDKVFKNGEAFSLKFIAKLLKDAGTDFIITADTHFKNDFGPYDFFGIKAHNISGGSLLVNSLKQHFNVDSLVVISPDLGSRGLVSKATKESGLKMEDLHKKRLGDSEVEMSGNLDVKEKDVLVLDDIISTGSTMVESIERSRKAGAKRIFAAATHGIFAWGSFERLNKTADYVVTTDSIENPAAKVTLAEEIAKVLENE